MKKTSRYLTIEIDLEREIIKKGTGTFYKDKLYFVKIKQGLSSTWFAETTLKKAFKRIKEELHL